MRVDKTYHRQSLDRLHCWSVTMICTQESLTCFCWHFISGVFMLQLYEANTASCHYRRHIVSSRDKCSSTTSTTANSSTANIFTCSICTNSSTTPMSPSAPPHSPSALPPPPPISPATARNHQLHHLHLLHYLHLLQNSSRCFVFLPRLCI